MSVEIKVPTLGESVTEATIAKWFKKAGDAVAVDEPLVELETDKVTLEVNAPATGMLAEVLAEEGSDVGVGALLGRIEEGDGAAAAPAVARDEEQEGGGSRRGQRPADPGWCRGALGRAAESRQGAGGGERRRRAACRPGGAQDCEPSGASTWATWRPAAPRAT